MNRTEPMKLIILLMISSLLVMPPLHARSDEATAGELADSTDRDSSLMNVDAIYARPFLTGTESTVGLGGYVEANVQTVNQGGINEGVDFQARRLTLFLSGSPYNNLRFLTEIEFENGTEEINIEFASLDLILHRLLSIRGGIILIPIGAFNQNHDGPRWNFIDRPISATQLLPATWSAAGFGVLGKLVRKGYSISYEAYLSNGLNNSIVSNADQRTSLSAGKADPLRFEESFNGHVMLSGRTAVAIGTFGEIGLSYAGGVYNLPEVDGISLTEDLWNHIVSVDYAFGSFADLLHVRAEASFVSTDLPADIDPVYASQQLGGYVDANLAFWRGSFLGFDNSSAFVGIRAEYVDFHLQQPTDDQASGDEVASATLALTYHPAPGTILRANYRNLWTTDLISNPAVRTTIFQFGLTTYF